MNYEEFKEYIREHLAEAYVDVMVAEQINLKGDIDKEEIAKISNCEVRVDSVLKNNGIILDTVCIYREGEQISPNIYIRPYYEEYIIGKPTDFIMAKIIFQYRNELMNMGKLQSPNLSDFDAVKDRIIIRLISKERNKEMLADCPHLEYLDLAIVFRYIVGEDKNGLATIVISNKEFDGWGMTIDELYEQALGNTVNLYPYTIEPLQNVVFRDLDKSLENMSEDLKEELELVKNVIPDVKLYILTNISKAFGACVILYDGVIRNFAKVHDANVYILPSSVHEIMIVAEDNDLDPAFLKELLTNANNSSVGLIDLLGDNIYYYDRETDSISIYETA